MVAFARSTFQTASIMAIAENYFSNTARRLSLELTSQNSSSLLAEIPPRISISFKNYLDLSCVNLGSCCNLSGMSEPNDLITVAEARALLAVSRQKMTDLIKQGFIKSFSNPLDKRIKYVSRAQVLKLRETYEEAA
jgi:hypothetical protein